MFKLHVTFAHKCDKQCRSKNHIRAPVIELQLVISGDTQSRANRTDIGKCKFVSTKQIYKVIDKCCVSGAGALVIDYANKTLKVAGHTLKEGDFISINGSTGEVYLGAVATKDAELDADFTELMNLADKYSRLKVRTNADTPHDAETARKFGAVGIGLCRTEHMFFEGEKIKAMREMILAETLEGRRAALRKILPYQQADFNSISSMFLDLTNSTIPRTKQ